ncbi:MAG: THUMP domain-containing protein [Acidobacteria bacterium]|nr:THUMP domain-containing protein [Acidobacteriota bacterium]
MAGIIDNAKLYHRPEQPGPEGVILRGDMAASRSAPAESRFLIRFAGDLGTKKGRALVQFRSRLARNLKDAMRSTGTPFSLQTTRGRIYVSTRQPQADRILRRVFGIQSFSRIHTRQFSTLEDIVVDGERLFGDKVAGKTFAVRARRSSVRSEVSFDSMDIERALGARLLDRSAGVRLSDPEVTVNVELTRTGAHYFEDVTRGPGGLPIGCEGKALALVSGGIDSVAAAWLMLKRGLQLDYLFFNLGDDDHREQVLDVVRVLSGSWSYGSEPRIYISDLRPWVHELRANTDQKLWQVLLKRLMIRGAEEIGSRTNSQGIVTGESLGQVSSQTLDNLAVIEEATSLPVLRPLIGFDKLEIIDLAKRIGTFDRSSKIPEYCALQGRGPTISADRVDLQESEARLDLDAFRQSLQRSATIDLRREVAGSGTVAGSAKRPSLAIDAIPDDATVIDLRPARTFEGWHYPGAVRLDYPQALRGAALVERGRPYVVCCEVEFKSADVAEKLRAHGHEAYYFRGGTGRLLRYAAQRQLVDPASVAPAIRD